MRKTTRSAVVFLICVAVAGVAFGSGLRPRGDSLPEHQTLFGLEYPRPDATVFGIVEVRGFVMDPRGVSRITLMLNGQARHDADLNVPRADVRRRFAKFGVEPFPFGPTEPGFRTSLFAPGLPNGSHTLAIRVKYSNGDEATLGERAITVDNTLTGQAPIGGIDLPRDPATTGWQDMISGVFPVTGWAIDDQGVRQRRIPTSNCDLQRDPNCRVLADIEVMVDDLVVGQVIYPLPRPDVANAFPDVPNAKHSGFTINLNSLAFSNGRHTLAVRVWDVEGNSRIIGRREIFVENHQATLGPFGRIDWPMENGHFHTWTCFVPPPISGVEYQEWEGLDWVSGWVVDQNDPKRFEGVHSVTLLFNGVEIKNTGNPSHQENVRMRPGYPRVQANVYGLQRPDILFNYPQFDLDAKYSGFFFAVDTGYWLERGNLRLGLNWISVEAKPRDPNRPRTEIARIPVIVNCSLVGDVPSFGELEIPTVLQDMSGVELIRGWVVDYNSLTRIEFWVDGNFDGVLVPGDPTFRMPRPDVELRFPWIGYPHSQNMGFEYMLDTRKYVDGTHNLVIKTVDAGGHQNYWVQRMVVFNNLNRP